MKVLFIGDVHIKHSNIEEVNILIEKLSCDADIAVLAGDILDTHEKIDTQLMNKAYELVKTLRKRMPVYILVGNHDYINNQQFLTDNHWMNGMKEWKGVVVVDTPLIANGFTFVPYVPPGRFNEALATLTDAWKSTQCIFAHQEFSGCKMGAIVSSEGDEWDLENPLVVSGHIHEPQQPQDNIIYPGSAINHSFGYDSQGLSVFEFINGGGYTESKINLGLTKKNIVYTSVDKIKSIPNSQMKKTTKFSIEGSLQEIKAFKESPEYKRLMKESKVVLKIKQDDNPQKFTHRRPFKHILDEMIMDTKNKMLIDDYKSISN